MSCDKYLDLISARLDGELTDREQAELAAHLRQCPACQAIAGDLEGLHTVLTGLGEVDAPAELSASVCSKINAERQRDRRRFVRRLSALAACLVLCVGVLGIADTLRSEQNYSAPASDLPSVARHIGPQPVALNRLDAYSLPAPADAAAVVPCAHILNSTDSLARFLVRFSQTDLSDVKDAYDADFFRANRLLAVVVQEPSSSITHRVIELTEDRVVILRDIPEAGDCEMALWLILGEVEGSGPESALTVELLTN